MIELCRWLFGIVSFRFFGGFVDGFVNECYQQKINLHDIKIKDNTVYALCSAREYKRLHKIAFQNGGRVKIIKKTGLVFVLERVKNRVGLMIGALLFVVIINVLSGFVWSIDIVGNERLTKGEISSFLSENGFHEGVHWHSISTDKIENLMMASFEDCAWVHINRFGSTARVEINEAVLKPKMDDTKGYTNLKAKRDGVITYINLKRGYPVVKVGEGVVAGDLLASGVFENELTKTNVFVHSAGEVTARVKEPFSLTVSRTQAERVYTDEKHYKAVYFFGITIGRVQKKGYENTKKVEYLKLNGKALPIAKIEATAKRFVDTEYSLTDKDLKNLAKAEIDKKLEQDYPDCEILEKKIKLSIKNDCAVAKGEIIFLENIAEEIKFY